MRLCHIGAQKMEALKEKHRYFMQFSLKDDCVHVSTVLSVFLSFFASACSVFLREWFFLSSFYTFGRLFTYHTSISICWLLCYHCFFYFLLCFRCCCFCFLFFSLLLFVIIINFFFFTLPLFVFSLPPELFVLLNLHNLPYSTEAWKIWSSYATLCNILRKFFFLYFLLP